MNTARSPIEPNARVTFKLRHHDDDLLVVEKPARLVTQPGVGHEHDTLLNGLFAEYGKELANMGAARDYGLVHRLDRDTSGLLVIALSHRAYDSLRKQFAERQVRKFYWALVHKPPRKPTGVIKLPILEEVKRRTRYTSQKIARLSGKGKPAVTAYRLLEASEMGALVEARPVTGRLHQIRLHLSSIGCAVLGDDLYGPHKVSAASGRLALHSHRLCFDHPVTGEPIDIRTGWPRDLRGVLRRLDLARPDLSSDSAKGSHEIAGDAIGEQEPSVGEPPAVG